MSKPLVVSIPHKLGKAEAMRRVREGLARPVSRLHPIGHLPERSARLWWRRARQKNPHPPGSLAFAAWVLARLGGWTGYYGKPGPVVMLRGLVRFHAIKHGWDLRNV